MKSFMQSHNYKCLHSSKLKLYNTNYAHRHKAQSILLRVRVISSHSGYTYSDT